MTREELNEILKYGEGHKVEFMAMPSKLDREIVAFANASGGRIFIGVDDSGEVVGTEIDDDLKSHIQDLAKNCKPTVRVELDEVDDVLVVTVEEGWSKPHRFSAHYFLRNGPVSHKFEGPELANLLEKVGRIRFEELINTEFEYDKHFDQEKFNKFIRLLGLDNSVKPEWLLPYLNLAEKQEERLFFTNLGVMFFSRDMSEFFPHAGIRCARYNGVEKLDVLVQQDFNEDVLYAAQGALQFLEENVHELKSGPIGSEDIHSIPYEAVEEAVINAIVHRDYFIDGNDTKIEIFNNRIVISNPGGLVTGLTADEFGERSMLRNPYLADIFHKVGLLDAWGTGISEMQRQVEDARLRPVDFEFDNFFTVTFWRPRNVTPDMERTRVKPKRDLLFQDRSVPEDARVEKPVREEPEKRPPEKTAPANVFDSDLKENLADKFNFRGQQLDRVFALLKDIFRGKALDYDKFEKKFDVSTKTIKRDIKKLKDLDMIAFEGAPKTGTYVMTQEGTDILQDLAE
ncbi:MAG: hypothetical protein GF372_10435 [Candidatus Marinimicrobia bacterium]|nr:hypothetical protein [Candidatus Neomarinimicrobiota bacterium]